MGLRLRRKWGKGPIYLNISGTGISLGIKTLISTYNIPLIGRKPWRATVGLPGVGLNWISQKAPKRSKRK